MIITGCPRSGTAYISKLLTLAGIPCGHEQQYNNLTDPPHNFRTIVPRVHNPKAESSWWAVPHLQKEKDIIHIVRNPLKVISSMMAHDFLGGKDLEEIEKTLPKIREYEGIERYTYFWIEWNSIIEKHTNRRYRVEDIGENPRKFLEQFIEPRGLFFKTNYNSWGKHQQQTLDDIPDGKVKTAFFKKRVKYGYERH